MFLETDYTQEEHLQRSRDLDELCSLIIEYSMMSKGARNISSNRTRINNIQARIRLLVHYNQALNENINSQNEILTLFEL